MYLLSRVVCRTNLMLHPVPTKALRVIQPLAALIAEIDLEAILALRNVQPVILKVVFKYRPDGLIEDNMGVLRMVALLVHLGRSSNAVKVKKYYLLDLFNVHILTNIKKLGYFNRSIDY